MDNDPERTVLAVLDLREFRRVWVAMDQAEHPSEVPTGPMADRVTAAMAVRIAAAVAAKGEPKP